MKKVKKPWGNEKNFILNEKCSVKIIEVNPNQKLSLQKHKKRSEAWFFLTEGYVQIGKKIKKIEKDSLLEIPNNTAHRLFAKKKIVRVLEISRGFFDSKDIIRLEDEYGRK